MEQRNVASVKANEKKPEKQRRLPRLFRLDDVVLTQMLLSEKPIMGISKSVLRPVSPAVQADSPAEDEEFFFFRASWQAVC